MMERTSDIVFKRKQGKGYRFSSTTAGSDTGVPGGGALDLTGGAHKIPLSSTGLGIFGTKIYSVSEFCSLLALSNNIVFQNDP